jgi:metal transporter CNNM
MTDTITGRLSNTLYYTISYYLMTFASDVFSLYSNNIEVLIIAIQVIIMLLVAAVCSGLNVALMSLSVSDLRRLSAIGDSKAKKVLPLRQNSHLSLAGILFTNVAANSAVAIYLNQYLIGIVAGFISTILLVIFGEILPQAMFTRNALKICASLSWLIRLMIIITYPLSKPTQLLLDKLFQNQAIQLHSRRELGFIFTEHVDNAGSELDDDEVEIIQNTLQLSEKRVSQIMTPIRHVFWLENTTIITPQVLQMIIERNYSRIPIFNESLTECNGILLMKDLLQLDSASLPISIDKLPLYSTKLLGSRTVLDTLFRKFIAAKTHMMPVEKDDAIIGVVTIEDLLEEIIGHEIEDESDRKKKRSA